MSSLLFALCMILPCLSSLHACHARHHLHKHSSEIKHSHNFRHHVKNIRHVDESDNSDNLGGAIKISKSFTNGLRSGSDYQIETSSGDDDMQQDNDIKGLKREMRVMMGTNAGHDTEDALESKDNEIGEDIVVMDYAQPHKKPPIHNEKL